MILLVLVNVLMFGVIVGTSFIYGLSLESYMVMNISKLLYMGSLRILLFSSIASMVVYGMQKTAASITAFILLATHTVYLLATMILDQPFVVNSFGNITKYLPTSLLNGLSQSLLSNVNSPVYLIPLILLYFAVSFMGSTLLFRHKELEF